MKQTAVQWLVEQYINKSELTREIIEQAKAMEKEQIIDAVSRGWWNNENGLVSWIGEQYYNETFKSE